MDVQGLSLEIQVALRWRLREYSVEAQGIVNIGGSGSAQCRLREHAVEVQ